jgi:hypothetical protein
VRLIPFLLVLLTTACGLTLVRPIWHLDDGVADLCTSGQHSYTHEGVTKTFRVHVVDDDTIWNVCGDTRTGPAQACTIDKRDIYVPAHHCTEHVGHEINHVFGMDFVDV